MEYKWSLTQVTSSVVQSFIGGELRWAIREKTELFGMMFQEFGKYGEDSGIELPFLKSNDALE